MNPHIVETWLKGWSLARGLPAPVRQNGILFVNVGWPQQAMRYVFPRLTDKLKYLAERIVDPWVFLKICAKPETVKELLPSHWVIRAPAFMMTCYDKMTLSKTELPKGYVIDINKNTPIAIVRVLTSDHMEAAIGRVVIVDHFAIYDRIETHPDHRRNGLGSIVMKTLEALAINRGARKGILVATAEGRALYEKLGWSMYTPYTTAVIPGIMAERTCHMPQK
ncbi:MAG: GNAT family N-acetyltransferase [Candidatus Pedobacter colombiensis]|uniref:GNAT family N-acetyltransferase n=1 Tax=Candidatus Pedobacter colombiensis TaxID=3121371 RepID=A0AAJ5WC27_9SPHI|nr:GNAT family N-acetyltransferase [Pedobacter sp.]WEK20906.1 MAG: GNAT family N-acetyltransferase [Pedobacter sp.]